MGGNIFAESFGRFGVRAKSILSFPKKDTRGETVQKPPKIPYILWLSYLCYPRGFAVQSRSGVFTLDSVNSQRVFFLQ